MAISKIPTTELLDDRAVCGTDIRLCVIALRGGIEIYGDGDSVEERLEGNKTIIAKIDAELARRSAGGMKNPHCGHEMEKDVGVVSGPFPFQAVYHCPFRRCIQWLIEFPVETYTAPTCLGCGHELATGKDGKPECGECAWAEPD